jgi:hypothetical protein
MRFATIDRVEPVARNNNDAPRPGIEFAEEVVGESVGRVGWGLLYIMTHAYSEEKKQLEDDSRQLTHQNATTKKPAHIPPHTQRPTHCTPRRHTPIPSSYLIP